MAYQQLGQLGQIKFIRKVLAPLGITVPQITAAQTAAIVAGLTPKPGEPAQSFLSRLVNAATVAFPTEADKAYSWAKEQAMRYGIDLTQQKYREAVSNPFTWVAVGGLGLLLVLSLRR